MNRDRMWLVTLAWVVFGGLNGMVHAQITKTSSVLDSSGSTSSGGSFTNISAAGQPGGIAVSTGGSYVNQAGFLNTFLLRPNLDTDGDGLVDELREAV